MLPGVDGNPATMAIGETISFGGGQLSQLAISTYQVTWNTGEVLVVTDNGAYLDVAVGLGASDVRGTLWA